MQVLVFCVGYPVGETGLDELKEVIALVPHAPFNSETAGTRMSHCSC